MSRPVRSSFAFAIALAAAAALAIPASASAALASSTFDKGIEGWTLDSAAITYNATKQAAEEIETSGFSRSFLAPASFLAALPQAYGGVLSFELSGSLGQTGPYVTIQSASDGMSCATAGSAASGVVFAARVSLTELGSSSCQWIHQGGKPLSAAQFKAILAQPTAIGINANVFGNSTFVNDLDNVKIVATPQTTIDPSTPSVFDTSSPSIAFSSDTTGATFTCALDGAAAQPCTSPVKYNGLPDGAHSLAIVATAEGATDPTPATALFTTKVPVPTATPTPVVTNPIVVNPGPVATPAPIGPALANVALDKTKGATFSASAAGVVTLTIARKATGHQTKSSSTCSTKTKHGKACTSYVTVSTKTRAVIAGPGTVPFSRKHLKPGTYRATVTLSVGTTTSAPITQTFTVK